MMLKDQARREVYILSQKDDHILPALTLLGGFGSGVLTTRNPALVEAIPWALPRGDKGPVQLMMQGDEDDMLKSKSTEGWHALYRPWSSPVEKKTRLAAQAGTFWRGSTA